MDVTQAKPLHGFHQRKTRSAHPTTVGPRVPMPTAADLPEASAELREALDTWHGLIDAEREQARHAAAAHATADTATATYRAKVREALAAGDDPAKVKDETEKHRAIAKAHAEFSSDAETERIRLGIRLGGMLEAETAALCGPVEERINASAQTVRGSLTAVREAWAHYSRDFEMRRWLSHIDINGGGVSAYHGSSPLPKEVAEALAVLEDHIGALEHLKEDEANVRDWRQREGAA